MNKYKKRRHGESNIFAMPARVFARVRVRVRGVRVRGVRVRVRGVRVRVRVRVRGVRVIPQKL